MESAENSVGAETHVVFEYKFNEGDLPYEIKVDRHARYHVVAEILAEREDSRSAEYPDHRNLFLRKAGDPAWRRFEVEAENVRNYHSREIK